MLHKLGIIAGVATAGAMLLATTAEGARFGSGGMSRATFRPMASHSRVSYAPRLHTAQRMPQVVMINRPRPLVVGTPCYHGSRVRIPHPLTRDQAHALDRRAGPPSSSSTGTNTISAMPRPRHRPCLVR